MKANKSERIYFFGSFAFFKFGNSAYAASGSQVQLEIIKSIKKVYSNYSFTSFIVEPNKSWPFSNLSIKKDNLYDMQNKLNNINNKDDKIKLEDSIKNIEEQIKTMENKKKELDTQISDLNEQLKSDQKFELAPIKEV